MLARALMDEPELLLLDEPTAGLDLPSRERLIGSLDAMAAANPELPTVTVTHHLEEIPSSTSHALLLAGGRIVAAGPIAETLTAANVSHCFEIEVEVAAPRRPLGRPHRLLERWPPAADSGATRRSAGLWAGR